MKRAVIVDSTANIGEQLFNHDDVYQVNLNVYFEDSARKYTDTWDEENLRQFYAEMIQCKDLPTTSQPSPQDYAECFEQLNSAGYEEIIVLTIASKVSGTYQTAKMMADSDESDLKIYVIDSGTSTYGLKNMVEHVLKWYAKDLPTAQILERLQHIIAKTIVYGAVHDLTNFTKGGRINHLGGRLAGMLKVGAVFSVYQGEIDAIKVSRGKTKIRKAMDKILAEYIEKQTGDYRLAVTHSNIHDVANKKATELRAKYTAAKEIVVDNLTIVLGTQLGEDVLVYVYLPFLD